MSEPETEELNARFAIDPTTPGDHGQSDPEIMAALAEAGRAALARVQGEQQFRNDMMATENGLAPDAKDVDTHVSQYHTSAGERLDFRGRPRGDQYDPNFQKPLVTGQYHTSAGHPLDMTGKPVDYDRDAHYNEQVRMVGVAHQIAPAHQTMAGQYHTSGGYPLDQYGLPIADAEHQTMLNVLPADKSSPLNVETRNQELADAGPSVNPNIGSDTEMAMHPESVEAHEEHHNEEHHNEDHHE